MKPITKYYLYYKGIIPFGNPRSWFWMARMHYKYRWLVDMPPLCRELSMRFSQIDALIFKEETL